MRAHRVVFWAVLIGAVVAAALVVADPPGSTAPAQTALDDNAVGRLPDGPMPGVGDRAAVPRATGNSGADQRIRDVAIARGYRLRGDPLDPLGSYQGRPLQQRAIDDLVDLQAAMRADIGATLTLTSAYRSVSRQRQLFLGQLAISGATLRGRTVTNGEIAAGLVDDVLNHAMRIAAPPGLSRHHTGLVIDVSSGGLGGFAFADSAAYGWLTENNYENAMAHGWVPSYPPRASGQGPNPEPWEWAWIGRDAAACARAATCASGGLDRANDAGVAGWATTPTGAAPTAYRLLTADGTDRFTPDTVTRFDLEVVFGPDAGDLGFAAVVAVPRAARWACVEARPAAGDPWSRVGCLDLS